MSFATREEWLVAAVEAMRPLFHAGSAQIPAVKVSVGFPSRGAVSTRRKTLGQCWDASTAADGIAQIFVTPLEGDAVKALAILAHELVHAVCGSKAGHRGPFAKLARKIGLEGKLTETTAGAFLLARLNSVNEKLGPYPHAALTVASGRKKQTTRLRLYSCDCGIKVRVAKDDFDATCGLCSEPFKQS